jgi:protoporphyrinogen/coproporphyrinogen III oxidase
MGSLERDGFTLNRGAQLLPSAYTAAVTLARDLGLGPSLQPFVPRLAVMRGGRRYELRGAGPGMALDGLRTGLLSPRSKLLMRRLAADALRMRKAMTYEGHDARAGWDTESIAEYCARRLNDEIRDYVIDPVMRGLCLIDSREMSVVDFFFTALNMLGTPMLRYPAGYDFLPRALAARVRDVRTGVEVESVTRTEDGVEVVFAGSGAGRTPADGGARGTTADGGARGTPAGGGARGTLTASGALLALPGPAAARVYPCLDGRRREILTRETTTSVAYGVHYALPRRPPEDLVAITVPGRELEGLATITFEHTSMPGCVPPGKGLISGYFTDDWCRPRESAGDDQVIAEATALVDRVLPGAAAAAEFAVLDRWAPSIPVSRTGIHRLSAELHRLSDPHDRVQLAGDFASIATVNACVVSGETAARRLAASLRRDSGRADRPVSLVDT